MTTWSYARGYEEPDAQALWRQKDVKDERDKGAKPAEKRKNEVVDRLGIRRRINHYLPEGAGGGDSSNWINVQESQVSEVEDEATTLTETIASPRRNVATTTLPTSVGQPLRKEAPPCSILNSGRHRREEKEEKASHCLRRSSSSLRRSSCIRSR